MKKLALALMLSSTMSFGFAADKMQEDLKIESPYLSIHKTSEGKSNNLTVVESGIAALQVRLDMIRNAKKNIEVEYFIYNVDASSKLITTELVKAAKRGVKVRMLVDKSAAIFVLDEYYAKALAEKNVEVRYYNAAGMIRISSINFRNHRKLISVDDKIAITGGRNVEDDYYDFSPEFNFNDRDVIVEGDMVKVMRESFDKYFSSKITERPELPVRPKDKVYKYVKRAGSKIRHRKLVDNSKKVSAYEKRIQEARDHMNQNEEDLAKLAKVESVARPIVNAQVSHSCPVLTFATDRPGARFRDRIKPNYLNKFRHLRKVLRYKLDRVNHKVYISSPYMLNNGRSRKVMYDLLAKDVEINLYTNSLASTDAVYVAANLYKDVFRWAGLGLKTYVHAGNYLPETDVIDESVKGAKWGTHSKTQVYQNINDDGTVESEVLIGTYNVDRRSNYYNTEMTIFCKGNEELANEVIGNIKSRMDNGYQIHADRTATDKDGNDVSVFGVDSSDKGLMFAIMLPSWLLKFLL